MRCNTKIVLWPLANTLANFYFLLPYSMDTKDKAQNVRSYKIEITQTEKFVIHADAENEDKAKEIAMEEWNEVCRNGTYHYSQVGDTATEISQVYDVTGTDDANS